MDSSFRAERAGERELTNRQTERHADTHTDMHKATVVANSLTLHSYVIIDNKFVKEDNRWGHMLDHGHITY